MTTSHDWPDLGSLTADEIETARNWTWTERSGRQSLLRDLEDRHLANLARHLRRWRNSLLETHQEALLMMVDDKNRSSFSGQEDSLELAEEAEAMVAVEISARLAQADVSEMLTALRLDPLEGV